MGAAGLSDHAGFASPISTYLVALRERLARLAGSDDDGVVARFRHGSLPVKRLP